MSKKSKLNTHGRNHLFHMVQPSSWPIFTAYGLFIFLSGLIYYMHCLTYGGIYMIAGFILLVYCAYFWFSAIISEATFLGYHTLVVKRGLKRGFLLFLVSELMLFLGFFWAFFHSAFCPSILLGSIWPPIGLTIIGAWGYPFFNTILLIVSGFGVTWAHRGIALGLLVEAIDGLCLAIFLGGLFLILQIYEYYEADFNISDGVYASTFYMLTGLHGCHVFIGVFLLAISLLRLCRQHFTTTHYLGFVFSIWYWHFVDAVWIGVFVAVYWWGGYL